MGERPQAPIAARPADGDGAGNGAVWTASPLVTAGILLAAVVILYYGQDVLVPFALATLLSFALAPLVTLLRRWAVPRVPAILLVVTFAFAVLGGFGLLVGSQLIQLAGNLPTYQTNIQQKIRAFHETAPGGGVIERATAMVRELGKEVSPAPGSPGDDQSVPVVRLQPPPSSPMTVIREFAAPLLGPIGTAGIVVVFVIFMLLEREDLRNRLIRLIGGDLYLTTEAIDETTQRVTRYLLMQLLVNATYALPIGIGLFLIGVPNALLWAVLAMVLRFIPYVGPFIAASFPIALSIAVAPGWDLMLWTVALFVVVELISNNMVEPWLYGSSTGISAFAIIIAATFWTSLWGPAGLFLSTPLTVCLAVLGRYVPQLRFLDVMLGSEPVLTPEQQVYQRMLAGDPDEVVQIAEEALKSQPLAAFYDEIMLPALRLAEQDRQRRALSAERRAVVTDCAMAVIAELADYEEAAADKPVKAGADSPLVWSDVAVLSIAGRSGLDMTAAAMLGQLLERQGLGCRILPATAVAPDALPRLDLGGVQLVCLSYLGAAAVVQARQQCRRLRRRARDVTLVVGLWNRQVGDVTDDAQSAAISADLLATSLTEAARRIVELASVQIETPMVAAPIPANEPERLAEVKRLGLLDSPAEDAFDQVTRGLARAFDVPISLMTLVDDKRQFWKSQTGLPADLAQAREAPRATSLCGHVVALDEPLVVEDVLKDRRFANNPFLRSAGIRFYAGVPLRGGKGLAVGALCVMDHKPRGLSPSERKLLQMVADDMMREMEHRSSARAATGTGPA